MSNFHKRRKFFINKDFQGKYIFAFFLVITLSGLIFISFFSFLSSSTLSIVYDNYHLQIGATPEILIKKILSSQWVFIVIGGGFVIWVSIVLTHRVAGPFYRFERSLEDMIGGDLSGKIILREKDEGKDLAHKLNAFNYILGDKLAIIENFNSNVAISSLQLKKILTDSGMKPEVFQPFLNDIMDSQKNIQAMINDYTFSRDKL